MDFNVVIPARLGSTRLPRKVLLEIGGRPLLQHVWTAASRCGARQVVVATDSTEVRDACVAFGADVEMTSPAHASGTDRINEVAVARGWTSDAIVVNLQGDEPLMPPACIVEVAQLLFDDATADIATLAYPIGDAAQWRNPNVVKVVLNEDGTARYFSRAPIPWNRDRNGELPAGQALRHIGMYAYRVGALARFSALPAPDLERIEALEQLRALAHGMTIRVGVTANPPPPGVDTEEDLRVAAQVLASR